MKRSELDGKPSGGGLTAVVVGLGTAVLFEALTALETQDKTVRAASPWQADPYDAVVSLAKFTVPMLAVVTALRLVAWSSPGGPDRSAQLARATATMTALVVLTLGFEWAAFAGRVDHASWNGWTGLLVAGLSATSLLSLVEVVTLVRRGDLARRADGWTHDWLDDVLVVCERVPVLRRWAGEPALAWVRRHVIALFCALSLFAALVVVGGLALGEGWRSPALFGWAVTVEATAYFAFCVISNAIAGFVVGPARQGPRRTVEISVVTGCVVIHIAVAFRDALWHAFTDAPLTSLADLTLLTLGAGVVAAVLTAAALVLASSLSAPTKSH